MLSKNASPQQIKQTLVQTITMHQQGDLNKALKGYKAVLKADPQNLAAKMFYGAALNQAGQKTKALKYLNEVLLAAPDNVDVRYHLGKVYQSLNKLEEAYTVLTQGLKIAPDNVAILSTRSKVLADMGTPDEGLKDAQKALSLNRNYIEAHLHAGVCCSQMAQFDTALDHYKAVLAIDSKNAEAFNNIGALYMNHEKYEEAIQYFLQALAIKDDYPSAHNNIGVCYYQGNEYEKAIEHFDQALALQPAYANAMGNKAGVLRHIGRFEEAKPLFEKALKTNPDLSHVHSNFLMCLHYIDDVEREYIFKQTKLYDKNFCQPYAPKGKVSFKNSSDLKKKLRVGMVSGSFCRHPVGYMILPGLDHTDSDQIEYYGYSDLKPNKKDDFTTRIQDNCAQWSETLGLTDEDLYNRIREDEIDILLDLTGHAEGGGRLLVFARRAAPVQVEWIGGLFDTSGLSEMDWIIGDDIEIPDGDDEWYTERVYRMPDDYICYEPPHYAPDVTPLPALENGYVTFGNLNNPAKTNDYSLKLWAQVLKAVPNSRLLSSGRPYKHEFMVDRFIKAFEEEGIDKDRLVFETGAGHIDFIGTYNRIDIALDPYPYSGGLTTCEALWMGVPVIALPGPTFAGKHAATHLYNSDMSDWIVDDHDAYIALAKDWAENLEGLSALRQGLRDQVAKSSLVDGKRFAENLEKAFRFMWEDWVTQNG